MTEQREPPEPLLFFLFFFLVVVVLLLDEVAFETEVPSAFDLTERETRAASVKAYSEGFLVGFLGGEEEGG